MTSPQFAFNPALDVPELASAYAIKKRLQIREVFADSTAEAVLAVLETRTPWGLAFNNGEQVIQLSAAQMAGFSLQDRQRISATVAEGARRGYQFLYAYYPLLQAYFSPDAPWSPLFPLFEWLNGPEFLGFAKRLTGLSDIRWVDAQATMFNAGHFLKYHTDETPSQKRLAAYVINFTKDWGRDWGGFLQFFDDKYDVEEGLRPLFNAINIFTIPMDHSVSVIAPYVARSRFSITGWLRGDDPPHAIGGRS
jgi:SM-20-related protein